MEKSASSLLIFLCDFVIVNEDTHFIPSLHTLWHFVERVYNFKNKKILVFG